MRKKRQCPFCKSKKGFEIHIFLGGTHVKHMSFDGKVLFDEREGTDKIENFARCLDCKKLIDVELLDMTNV